MISFIKKIILLSALFLAVYGCSSHSIETVSDEAPTIEDPEEFPKLRVLNQTTDNKPIVSVRLVGYEFFNLNITQNNEQVFSLEEGMPGGYENINVIISYLRYPTVGASRNISVDFADGEITTVVFKGCSGAEGCHGHYLE